MTLEDRKLIDAYLASGGVIHQCPDGDAMHPFKSNITYQPMQSTGDDE